MSMFTKHSARRLHFSGALVAVLLAGAGARGDTAGDRPIQIANPRLLSGQEVCAICVPLGIPNDYKPFLARLRSGDLLIIAFCFGGIDGVDGYAERAIFWRSQDGGHSWGPREERIDIQGREFGLTVLHDGTLLMTCHWLSHDVFNPSRHTHSKVFRSTDEAKTWSEIRIGPDGFPDRAETVADWMAFEIPDPNQADRWMTCLGVSMQHGNDLAPQVVRIWRSQDSGKSWDKSLHPDTAGWSDVDGFFFEMRGTALIET